MTETRASPVRGHAAGWLASLGGVCGLAFLLRALGFEWIFPGDGDVLLAAGDGHYHARLALYSFANFPGVLTWDPYLDYPDGASVPVPPLLDFLAAAVARALGQGVAGLERVLAWSTPVYGALGCIPVYLAARCLTGRPAALGAAALFAALPVAVTVGRVGAADHHAAVALEGALLLWLSLAAVAPGTHGTRLALTAAGLALARLALLLSWSGSLLYLGLADALLLLAAALSGRRDLPLALGLSALASAIAVLPVVLWLPSRVGGVFSSLTLSGLHVWAGVAVAAVAGLLWTMERWRPSRGLGERGTRLLAAGAAIVLPSLALPALREGLLPGLAFVAVGTSGTPGWAVAELLPLFSLLGRPAARPATEYWGHFAYLIPLVPLAALFAARRPGVRASALLLSGWSSVLGALAVWQVRYGADFAAAASIGFALLLAGTGRLLRRLGAAPSLAALGACALGALLLIAPARVQLLPLARSSLATLLGRGPAGDRALATPSGSLVRFLQEVRRETPDTAGYLDASGVPEYGLLNRSGIGHPLHYVARRASPADGFLGVETAENLAAARRFFASRSEAEALEIAARLRARYVVTLYFPGIAPGSLEARLQFADGLAPRPLEHFRLVTEGPRGGLPLSDLLGFPRPERVVPYKLFEIVPGALLEVRGTPGAPVAARLTIVTPLARRFDYVARAVVGDDGVARLRVPYATDGQKPARARGAFRVRVGEAPRRLRASVSEQDVRQGRTIVLGP